MLFPPPFVLVASTSLALRGWPTAKLAYTREEMQPKISLKTNNNELQKKRKKVEDGKSKGTPTLMLGNSLTPK